MDATIALVTGANRGLGLEIARGLGRAGMTVLVAGRRRDAVQRAAEGLRAEEIDARPLVLDVTDPASVRAAAEQVDREHGVLDLLVNNAGILPEATEPDGGGPLSLELFRRTFDTNLFGAVSVVEAFAGLRAPRRRSTRSPSRCPSAPAARCGSTRSAPDGCRPTSADRRTARRRR